MRRALAAFAVLACSSPPPKVERAAVEELVAPEPIAAPESIAAPEPIVAQPSPEAELERARALLRTYRWTGGIRLHPRACVIEQLVFDGEGSEGHSETFQDLRLDANGRVTLEHWNTDAAALSGEIRTRYDALGNTSRVDSQDYEGIEDERPPAAPTTTYTYARAPNEVTATLTQRGASIGTDRYRFDEAGRVVDVVYARTDPDTQAPAVHCEYDGQGRPSARVRDFSPPLREEYVYDGDRLVEVGVVTDAGSNTHQVWAVPDGFAVGVEGELERFRGACTEIYFGVCSPRIAPSRTDDGARASLPAIVFGRSIGADGDP